MSQMTIVRHGQASFFADDYDKLSDLGEQQVRLLGSHWAKLRIVVDEVYCGPRSRQRRSAELAGIEYRKSGLPWPEVIELSDLDEYDLNGLNNNFTRRLAEQNSEFARLVEIHRKAEGEKNKLRDFQRMFETMLGHWQTAEELDDDVESWPDFHQRVARVIRHIQERPGKSRRVALFTSGGFIGCAVQQALGTEDRRALELNWRIRNSSVTEFIFTPDRFTLDSFNTIPHLHDPAMWTYR